MFWKDSLDFTRIVKEQRDDVEPKGAGQFNSPDRNRGNIEAKRKADEAVEQFKRERN